ncbi:MAG: poly(R)-hydroxyalkanoic acid synthase subunit PhaE [Bacteroidia bacterium]
MKTNETLLDTWMGITNNMMNNWKKAANSVSDEQEETVDAFSRLTGTWMSNYRKMVEEAWKPFTSMNNTNAPFSPMLNRQNSKPGEFVVDQLSEAHKVLDQYSSYMHSLRSTLISSTKSFSLMPGVFPSFDSITKMYPHTMSGWYMEFFNSAQKSLNPFFHFNNNFNWADPRLFVNQAESISNYINKARRMQFLLTNTSIIATEKVIAAIYDRIQNGKAMPGADDLYNEWSVINEKEFNKLFLNEEYVLLQEDLVSLHSDLMKMYDKQMETLMKPLPVSLRSEMDDMYKSNHDLRSRMNKVEKEMA